jgi:serine/threonine protein kinase
LLTRLVSDGLITQYQAEKFLNGQSGDIYFGDYVVIDKLGQGGMGTVLLAKHRRMDRQVAIKVLPVTALDSEAAVARFYQEVKVAAKLTHPNIVHAYDAGEHHGFHYLVMEYVPGHDLARVLSELGPIPPMLALEYISQATAGLEYAHRKGVVHRDIKPSNLLLDDEGNIKVLDMGLARIGGSFGQEESAHLTTTGQMMGTVEYMSPEQAEDTRAADARSDIYSLGCTLYRLLTGNGPFSRDTVVKTILAHRDSPVPPIELGMPEDEIINQLFRKMVAKRPEDRFQTTSQLQEALQQVMEGEGFIDPTPALHSMRTDTDTAVVVHVDTGGLSDNDSIPEAIIPTDSVPATGSMANSLAGQGRSSTSEVVYIKDETLMRQAQGFLSRTIDWIRANPGKTTLIRGVISIATFGWLGLILGPLTWRLARKQMRQIRAGTIAMEERQYIRVGKFLSIAATLLSIIVLIQFLSS